MICSVSTRATRAGAFFNAALGPDARPELPLGERVIGHWPTLDEFFGDRRTVWPAENWVRYIEVPLVEYPFAVGPGNDRAAVLHFQARLHPDDRTLTAEDWAMIVHHLAVTAGIIDSDGFGNCRCVAIQTASDRVDFIANLINYSDGTWTQLPRPLHQTLANAVHDIEDRMDLKSTRPEEGSFRHPDVTVHLETERRVTVAADPAVYLDSEKPAQQAPPGMAALASQITCTHRPASLASLLNEVTDDRLGDLPRLRRFTETAAALAGTQTGPRSRDAQHRLQRIARRLHGIEEDLHGVAQILTESPATPRYAAGPPPPVAGNLPPIPTRR